MFIADGNGTPAIGPRDIVVEKDRITGIERRASLEGADAVIAMRYDATEFYQGSTEVLAYGTAVRPTPPTDS